MPFNQMVGGDKQQPQQTGVRPSYRRPDGQKWPSLKVLNLPEQYFYDLDLFKHFTSAGYKIKSAKTHQDKHKSRQ